jgi:hypothetical protein
MTVITRTWLAFAAIGIGLIHVALVGGAPLPIGIALATFGLAEFGWGVLAFSRDRIAAPKLVLAGAIAPILGWGLLVAAATVLDNPLIASSIGFIPMSIATILGLFVATTVAVHTRRGADFAAVRAAPAAGRYLVALMAGGLVIATLTTPALAATEAGAHAHPHGEHVLPVPGTTGHSGHAGH